MGPLPKTVKPEQEVPPEQETEVVAVLFKAPVPEP